MSNKTPPLVIPVVVDATGVSKGLNNVNDRLRRGVRSGGSGDGSFGSGGAMAAGAAALGAGAGAVAFSGSRRFNRTHEVGTGKWANELTKESRSTRVGRVLDNLADGAFSRSTAASGRIDRMLGHESWAADVWTKRQSKHHGRLTKSMNRWGKAANALSWSGLYASRSTNWANGKGAALGSAIYPVAGIAGAAAGIGGMAMNFAQNFKSSSSDMQNLVGNPMYGKLRPFQLRQNMSMGTPTKTQNFMAGSLMMTGGSQTRIERNTNSVNSGVGGMLQMIGAAYENPQAAWLGIKASLGFQVTGNQMMQTVINRSSN